MMVISEIRYLRFNNCSVIQTGGHRTVHFNHAETLTTGWMVPYGKFMILTAIVIFMMR
jgi:hypothetical protein